MVAAMNPAVDDESNIKRLQRLVDEVKLEAADKRHFVLMGRSKVRVSLDRTEWDFGSVTNNLLTAGVETNGLAVPVHTKDLGKCGSSNDDERIQAVDAILEIIPVECIEVLTADREFLSIRFLAHLLDKGSEPALSSAPTQEFTSSISLLDPKDAPNGLGSLENPSNALPTSINTISLSSLGVPSSVGIPE
jgi:hypothetical protein